MTIYHIADIGSWSAKARRNLELVVKGSAQDVSELMTRRQPSVADTGGSFEVGRVPVDTGELISSVVIDIGGMRKGTGANSQPPDFAAAIAGFEIGQDIVVAFTAPYARHVEYGTGRFAGRFFTRNAVQQWRTVVEQNARQYKD